MGLKWVAGFAKNYQSDLPNVTGLQVYNDIDTGIPLAVMECGYLTGLRTAAVSSIIARECALPEARTLALAGCGFEGTMHLWFLVSQIPSLREICLRDIRPAAMQTLKQHASQYFSGEIRICKDRLTEDGQPDPEFPGGLPEIYATIGEVVTRRKPARTSATERIVAIPIGMAICDVALGHLNFTKAVERGAGQKFRLL